VKNDLALDRLCTAMNRSRYVLKRFREERTAAVRMYVGPHWSEESTEKKRPLNMLALYVQIVSRFLVSKNPRVMLSTFNKAAKPMVAAMQSWANKEIEHVRLSNTLQRIVLDGLFSIGIAKVALATPADSALLGWNQQAGKPFCERVDLDDFVFDIHARDFSEVSFIGHRFRTPLAAVKDSKIYNKNRKNLQVSLDNLYNVEGDERISVLGRTTYSSGNESEYEDFVDLWEIYLPRHRAIVTLEDSDAGPILTDAKPLREQNWVGPDSGPYHLLAYGMVPGNAMPKAPVQDLRDLDDAINKIYRKLIRQAERQKENTFVRAGATEDGSRVMEANDGEILRVDNPEQIKMVLMGGPNQQNMAFGIHLSEIFDKHAGNLSVLGGLQTQAKTLGQEELLSGSATKGVADLQDRTVESVTSIIKALCWFWHHDPFNTMTSQLQIPGAPSLPPINRTVTPGQRIQIPFKDLDIKVDPYSMAHSTPQQRMQQMNQVVTSIVLPMMQLMRMQGIGFDMNAYLQKLGTYMDMPDLAEILTIMEPPPQENQPAPSSGIPTPKPGSNPKPPGQRMNPGRPQASSNNLMSSIMGANPGGNPDATRKVAPMNGAVQ
jgi:hypothetical protein